MKFDPGSVGKILLIRYRSIGDILLTNPTLAAVREKFPNATIDMVVDDIFMSILKNNPNIDNVIGHKRNSKSLIDDFLFIRKIRANNYDLVIDLQGGPRGAWLTFFSGAKYRVGMPFRWRNKIAYNIYGEEPESCDHTHIVQMKTVKPLGINRTSAPEYFLSVDETALLQIRKKLAGFDFDKPLALLHPGARIFEKRWPSDKMGRLAKYLIDEKGFNLVIAGGNTDRDEVDKITASSGHALASFTDLTLDELIALISMAKLMVCNDSGPMHIAGVLNVPGIALFGPSDPKIWAPPGNNLVVVTPPPMECMPCDQKNCHLTGEHCMTKIELADVITAIEKQNTTPAPPLWQKEGED